MEIRIMGRIKLTRSICYAAASDAGNASMRRGNRVKWNSTDYNAAIKEYNRLLDILYKN